jgi:glycerol-3-phosphate dehydrogenase subunit C
MPTRPNQPCTDAETLLRGVVEACADCDTCRFLMDESCLLFPRLYQLWDEARDTGRPIPRQKLHQLAELCTLCGLCPCPNIRTDIIQAKAARVATAGMPFGVRFLADVQRFARLGGAAPGLINRLLAVRPLGHALKKLLDIHPRRDLPRLAPEPFFSWARKRGLNRLPDAKRRVAYFAGCTAGYLFPEVARAVVGVLEHNGIAVHVPEQQCCGMPTLLEGDRPTTLERAAFNLTSLGTLVQEGWDIICSCPTCGFLLKVLLKENACYSEAYQRSVRAGAEEIMVPDDDGAGGIRVRKSIYAKILRDNGLFSEIDPLARIAVSAQVHDLGAYLARLDGGGGLDRAFGRLAGRLAYYAPCHQREQNLGSPYRDLLEKIPGVDLVPVGGPMDCCGMGGSLGYKRRFHHDSLRLGTPLMEKIKAAQPEAVVTDCLSCRLQFRHLLPYPVHHPVELLRLAYAAANPHPRR